MIKLPLYAGIVLVTFALLVYGFDFIKYLLTIGIVGFIMYKVFA